MRKHLNHRELRGQAVDLLVHLVSHQHLWPRTERVRSQIKEMNFLCRLSEQLQDTLERLYLSLLPEKAGGAGQERGRSGHRWPCELDPGN